MLKNICCVVSTPRRFCYFCVPKTEKCTKYNYKSNYHYDSSRIKSSFC